MFVRVFNKENNLHYKSIVYGIIDKGYYGRYIVINPFTNKFELVNYFDEIKNVQIETIQSECSNWVDYSDSNLLLFNKKIIDENLKIKSFNGYKEVFDNFDFLSNILKNKIVTVENSNLKIKTLPDIDEWHYVQNQKDIDYLMEKMVDFHDALITNIIVDQGFFETKANVIFDNSGWYGIVELCFEGVQEIKLCPAKENYSNEIYVATLRQEDGIIFWSDTIFENDEYCQQCSYIKALNLKWKKLD